MSAVRRLGNLGWLAGGVCVLLFVATVLLTGDATAADTTPLTVGFQGRLTTAAGVPVEGPANMVFRFHTASTGGTLLYAESRSTATGNAMTVTQGNYAVALGGGVRITPFGAPGNPGGEAADFAAVFAGNRYVWLELEVVGETPMSPRIQIQAAGYAINADLLDGQDGTFYRNATNVDAGTLNVARLPADGYASTYVNVSGDTMTGALTVGGLVHSTSGGFKFPDNSVQQTKAARIYRSQVVTGVVGNGVWLPGSITFAAEAGEWVTFEFVWNGRENAAGHTYVDFYLDGVLRGGCGGAPNNSWRQLLSYTHHQAMTTGGNHTFTAYFTCGSGTSNFSDAGGEWPGGGLAWTVTVGG